MYYSLNGLVVLFPVGNCGYDNDLFIFCRAIVVLYCWWKKNSEYHILCTSVHVLYCARLWGPVWESMCGSVYLCENND